MAKKSSVEKNKKREEMSRKFSARRTHLKTVIANKETSVDERFSAALRLAKLPRNSSKTRIRNRCGLSGRPRGYYRKLGLSRIALRELTSAGLIPGMTKSSW